MCQTGFSCFEMSFQSQEWTFSQLKNGVHALSSSLCLRETLTKGHLIRCVVEWIYIFQIDSKTVFLCVQGEEWEESKMFF